MALVFGTFAIEDPSLSQTITDVDKISFVLKIIEVVILGIFSIEILLKVLAFGFKVLLFFLKKVNNLKRNIFLING